MSYISLQGKMYVAVVSAGVPGAFRYLGNIPEGGVSLNAETFTHKESTTGQRLEDLRIPTGKSATLNITLEDWSKENLAMGLYGASSTISASTVTAEQFPNPVAVGDIVRLNKRNVSSVVVKDSAGTPATLVQGTDYEITSAKGGLIKVLNLGGYVQPFKADYSYGAMDNINMFTQSPQELWVMFDGIDTANSNKGRIIELYRVQFNPISDLQLLHNEIGKLTLSGSVLYDSTKSANAELGQFGRIMLEV